MPVAVLGRMMLGLYMVQWPQIFARLPLPKHSSSLSRPKKTGPLSALCNRAYRDRPRWRIAIASPVVHLDGKRDRQWLRGYLFDHACTASANCTCPHWLSGSCSWNGFRSVGVLSWGVL